MDKDGMYSYSAVISISSDEQNTIITIFPNPVNSAEANVSIAASSDGLAIWKLIDNNGRTIISSSVQLRSGNNNMKINVSSLSAGIYYLSIEGAEIDQKVKLQKL